MRTLPADPTQAGRGKAQRAILAVLHAADAPTAVHVDEIARRAPCRGIHFAALERAADALTRRGLLEQIGDGYRLAPHRHAPIPLEQDPATLDRICGALPAWMD